MTRKAHRIFISKLPENVTNSDLQSKFSHYGTVTSTEINQRKNAVDESQSFFAYINLETTDGELQKCFKDFAHKKWQGEYIDVQIAKESFLTRLKREREAESQRNCGNAKHVKQNSASSNGIVNETPTKRLNKKVKYNSDEEVNETVSNGYVEKGPTRFEIDHDRSFESNKQEGHDGNIEHKAVTNIVTNHFQQENSKISNPKCNADNQKRLQSIINKRNKFRQQKSHIKNALASLDSKSNSKIVFDDDDVSPEISMTAKNKKSRQSLFNDSDDENEDSNLNFEVRKQFEGKKGQKLLQLQSKFKNDGRFTLNERFLEDEEDKDEKEVDINDEEITIEQEKEKQFGILQEVLGMKITNKPENMKSKQQIGMLRFDPSQPEHAVYELKDSSEKIKTTRKKTAVEEDKLSRQLEVDTPEVSKSKFYKVTEDLKDVFQNQLGGFSLLSAFKENESIASTDRHEEQAVDIKKTSRFPSHLENAFRYDSSSEEDTPVTTEENNPVEAKKKPLGLWTEPFFFQEDDYRFQEGIDFIRSLEVEDSSEFSKVRRSLKEIVKAKVRNNQRKNKMFKKKLGGRKTRIKMKKAFKK